MHSSDKQAERRKRGEDFQDELRRSWRLVPRCWRMRITDAAGRVGTRPADDIILLDQVNILCEAKRTAGDRFELSFLRPNQLRGLLEFDGVMDRNIGMVFVSFLNEAVDLAFAFRLLDALLFMKQQNRQYITLEELQLQKIKRVPLPVIELYENDQPVRGYDLKGVTNCYKY